jgi:hypothetical protein
VKCEKLVTTAKYKIQMPKLVLPGQEVDELAARRNGKRVVGGASGGMMNTEYLQCV